MRTVASKRYAGVVSPSEPTETITGNKHTICLRAYNQFSLQNERRKVKIMQRLSN